jgi:prepilin-type processing-associated H-X9-DG protein
MRRAAAIHQGNLRFRHEGETRCNVAFADGSVRQFAAVIGTNNGDIHNAIRRYFMINWPPNVPPDSSVPQLQAPPPVAPATGRGGSWCSAARPCRATAKRASRGGLVSATQRNGGASKLSANDRPHASYFFHKPFLVARSAGRLPAQS